MQAVGSIVSTPRRAVHEAGHVVACLIEGFIVARSSILRVGRSVQGYTQSSRLSPEQLRRQLPDMDPIARRQEPERHALVSVAGSVAERLVFGYAHDCPEARKAVQYLAAAGDAQDVIASRLSELGARAERIITAHRRQVMRMAGLLEHAHELGRDLEGPAIHQFWADYLAGRPGS